MDSPVFIRQRALAHRPPDAADLVAKALRTYPQDTSQYTHGSASDGSMPTWRQDGSTTYVGETRLLRSPWQVPFSPLLDDDIQHPTSE